MEEEKKVKEGLKLDDLPTDNLCQIFQYLEPEDLDSLSQANNRLRKVTQNKSNLLWKPHLKRVIGISELKKIEQLISETNNKFKGFRFYFWQKFRQAEMFSREWIQKNLQNGVRSENDNFYLKKFNDLKKNFSSVSVTEFILKLMSKMKIDINFQGPSGQTVSHFLICAGDGTVAELLIRNGANLSIKDNYDITALDGIIFTFLSINNGKNIEQEMKRIQKIMSEVDPEQAEEVQKKGTEAICRIS